MGALGNKGLVYKPTICKTPSPYDGVEFNKRDAKINEAVLKDGKKVGETTIFFQKDLEFPASWSQLAVNVVSQKYFRGKINEDGTPAPGRETSIKQLIDRVVDTIAGWGGYYDGVGVTCQRTETNYKHFLDPEGRALAYFDSKESQQAWANNLKYLLVNQYLCFNSPVWFNVGVEKDPQCSACFIIRLEDQMSGPRDKEFSLDDHSLLAAQVKEGIIFSRGSGSGINLSRVRSSKEWLSSGGRPTGPLSFARGLDTWASSIKSGGKTRRAAKMLLMDVDHPDIIDFIEAKAKEEKIAGTLLATGKYGKGMDSEALLHAFHQNSNLSVRVSDEFMEAAKHKAHWNLVSRSYHHLEKQPESRTMVGILGKVVESIRADTILQRIAECAWECADPGIQYHDTINQWHTCANDEPIFASNPCSEYLFIDETSCNLASLNFRKFFPTAVSLQDQDCIDFYVEAIEHLTVAMDIIVGGSKYPTENIGNMTRKYRTLGVGYANLGGMLMAAGLPYDSVQGRDIAALLMSIMTGTVYSTSATLAGVVGPFERYSHNKDSFTRVIEQHVDANSALCGRSILPFQHPLIQSTLTAWGACFGNGEKYGYRNAQATVLAPTGTISFMMDCETTGIEPEFSLVKTKNLAGGGQLSIPNPLVQQALETMGYSDEIVSKCLDSILKTGTITKSLISDQDREVFRTAVAPGIDPEFSIPWKAHVDMMAANQPFISGAISKTVNLPNSATVEDILETYRYGWRAGLKAIAVYRDGCKNVQALETAAGGKAPLVDVDKAEELYAKLVKAEGRLKELEDLLTNDGRSIRRKAPKEVDHKKFPFEIDGIDGDIFVGFYENSAELCEVYVWMGKTGSAIQGFVNSFCILFSWAIQYGIPLSKLVERFRDMDFKPQGFMGGDKDVKICRSVVDYIVRKVEAVVNRQAATFKPVEQIKVGQAPKLELPPEAPKAALRSSGLACRRCNSFDVSMSGSCTICRACGDESGGCFA